MKTVIENPSSITELANKYKIVINWHEEDQSYYATVPSLPGCAGHGDTYEEALECTRLHIRLILEDRNRRGVPIPRPEDPETRLYALAPILNVSEVARRSGINKFTLRTKINRKTPLSQEERRAIKKVLETL